MMTRISALVSEKSSSTLAGTPHSFLNSSGTGVKPPLREPSSKEEPAIGAATPAAAPSAEPAPWRARLMGFPGAEASVAQETWLVLWGGGGTRDVSGSGRDGEGGAARRLITAAPPPGPTSTEATDTFAPFCATTCFPAMGRTRA